MLDDLDTIGFDAATEEPAHGGSVSVVRLTSAAASDPAAAQAAPPLFQPTGRQGPDGVDLDQILRDRPDVLQGFYDAYARHDPNSHAWSDRIDGDTPQDFAAYWYKSYGVAEGYSQAGGVQNERIDIDQLLRDRPDVFQAFFTEYYGPNNDRHSSAWVDRVGGDTVQDYARYWYDTYGRGEGYTQIRPPAPEAPTPGQGQGGAAAEPPPDSPPPPPPGEPDPVDEDYRVEDPSLDPWNHPAIYPDYPRPPDAPPASEPHPSDDGYRVEDPSLDPWNHPAIYGGEYHPPADPLSVGQGLGANDPFG